LSGTQAPEHARTPEEPGKENNKKHETLKGIPKIKKTHARMKQRRNNMKTK